MSSEVVRASSSLVKAAVADDKSDPEKLDEKLDPVFQKRLRSIQTFRFKTQEQILKKWPFQDDPPEVDEDTGIMTWHGRVLITVGETQDIIKAVWEGDDIPSSLGRTKLHALIQEQFLPCSQAQVSYFLKHQPDSQVWRQRKRSTIVKATQASAPGSIVSMDMTYIPQTGPFKYIHTSVDSYSRYLWCTLATDLEAETCLKEDLRVIADAASKGVKVRALRLDNGVEQKNAVVQSAMKERGIKMIHSTPNNATGNPLAETLNRVVKTYLYSLLQGNKEQGVIKGALERIVSTYNRTVNSAHGFAPAQIFRSDLPPEIAAKVEQRSGLKAENTDTNKRYQPVLKANQRVRLLVEAVDGEKAALIKGSKFKASHEQVYTDETWRVKQQDRQGFVTLIDGPKDAKGKARKYLRGQVLGIEEDTPDFIYTKRQEEAGDSDEIEEPAPKRVTRSTVKK